MLKDKLTIHQSRQLQQLMRSKVGISPGEVLDGGVVKELLELKLVLLDKGNYIVNWDEIKRAA